MSEAELLSEGDAAVLLAAKPKTLANWRTTKRYNLPYVKLGRMVRYRRSDVEAFIQARMVDSMSMS